MSTEIGRMAEAAAVEWLQHQKFKIIAKNWRNRWCEIDIIAQKGNEIHFVEVKYRKSAAFGHGFDYITRDKIVRLLKAAQVWMGEFSDPGQAYHIDVVAIEGRSKPFRIEYLADAITA